MANRGLKLERFGLRHVNYQHLGAHRLRIEVTDPCNTGADVNVFLYLRLPPNPDTGAMLDEFHAVASPVDMSEYPALEPDGRTTHPFYRTSVVELDFRTTELADYAWSSIVAQIGVLLDALDRFDRLVPTVSVNIGSCDEGGGSSNSNSDSGTSASSESV